ncbi:MAG: hypothetical protein HZB40_07205 [Rhodocyclales bacterium]|nr:hypothetical protein [Rhodocyclales bacterium]
MKYLVTLDFQTAENADDDRKVDLIVEAESQDAAVAKAKSQAIHDSPELAGIPLYAWHSQQVID